MKIDWNPSLYRLNIDFIDEQHLTLINAINELREAYGTPNEAEAVKKTIQFIGEYVQKHFNDEEAYLESISYPKLEEHRHEHQKFIEYYGTLVSKYEESGASKPLLLSIYNSLFNWLVNHISSSDKEYTQ